MRGTVWTAGGCASWYLDAHGPQHDAVAGLHLALPRAHAPARPRALRAAGRAGGRAGGGRGVGVGPRALVALRGANSITEGREVAVVGARAVVLGRARLPMRFACVS